MATRACADRNAAEIARTGKNTNAKLPALLTRQKKEPDPLVQPGLAHANSHRQNSKDEEDGIAHESPRDLVRRQGAEGEHHDGHEGNSAANRQRLCPPQHGRHQQDPDHDHSSPGHRASRVQAGRC